SLPLTVQSRQWEALRSPVTLVIRCTGNSLSVYSLGVFADSGISEVAQLRLVNSSSRCSGRVEVLHNQQWGTVCDDSWDITDAGVVCRQLGCGTALSAPGEARFGRGLDRIWLDDVNCAGTETALSDCRARPWGENNCNHGEDAGVVCSGNPHLPPCMFVYSLGVFADSGISEVAQLRLVNSSSRCAGRVEVLHNQEWGTVCDDSWDLQDAGVVCRQLGCGTALLAPGGAQFGRGSDRIWLDDVNCAGTEAALFDCRARPWGDNNCNHGEDAGVECSGNLHPSHHCGWCRDQDGKCTGTSLSVYSFGVFADSGISEPAQLRLVNGPSHCAGRVEVLHNQQWGTVCDDGWDITDAGVVCRQLGCGTALSAPGGARFGRGSDPIWLDDVNCTGTEAALSDCRARPWEDNNCNHGEDAGVVCSGNSHLPPCVLQGAGWEAPYRTLSPHTVPSRPCLRLVNSPSRCAGRVEVLHNQQWGTVCDDNWDLQDAGVICRQLGCGTALSSPGGARFGQGSDHIWLDDVHCTGTEVALSDCRARPWGENNCNHRKDAGVPVSTAVHCSMC
uniref:Soluble scavenger receptor cysteine-rich domain-containing protein SSC5D n=1 Tax=Terrapene triunguis TaxID=2587831 RepID=A0A674J2F9_9SAUR